MKGSFIFFLRKKMFTCAIDLKKWLSDRGRSIVNSDKKSQPSFFLVDPSRNVVHLKILNNIYHNFSYILIVFLELVASNRLDVDRVELLTY